MKKCILFMASFLIVTMNSYVSSADNQSEFIMLPQTDLPGFDYRSPRNDPALVNTGKNGCMRACASDPNCKAFTYNTKAKWCWLKNGHGQSSKFNSAFSGIKQSLSNSTKKSASNFQILANTDIPGFDYRSPRNDPSLLNTGTDGCMNACQLDSTCQAFTYNTEAQWCFLKSGYKKAKRFQIAISGIKKSSTLGKITSKTERKSTLKSWPATIGEIRNAAVSYGGDCKTETGLIEGRFNSTNISVHGDRAEAGRNIQLEWQSSRIEKNLPVYLMISFDQPVRFEGNGFYPLMPNAKAGFGIEWNNELTRAIVPLYGRGASSKGQVIFKPLLEGNLNLEWGIAGYVRKCQQEITKTLGNRQYQVVVPAKFEVAVNEPASLQTPVKVLLSPDGKKHVKVFKDWFRLVDIKSGAKIYEGAGTRPNFSPTGRFLTIKEGTIFDTVDGGILYSRGELSPWDDIGWQNQDSFLVTGMGVYGIHASHFSLHKKMSYESPISCHGCGGLIDGFTDINLESNVAYVNGDGVNVFDLLQKQELYPAQLGEGLSADTHIRTDLAIADYTPPRNTQFIEQTQFTTILDRNLTDDGSIDTLYNRLIKASLLKPEEFTNQKAVGSNTRTTGKGQNLAARSISWRGAFKKNAHVNQQVLLERLSEIGLGHIPPDKADFHRRSIGESNQERQEINLINEAETNKIITQIYRDIPKSKGSFSGTISSFNCVIENDDKLIRRFRKAQKFNTNTKTIWLTHDTCVAGSGAFQYPTLAIFDNTLNQGFVKLDLGEEGNTIGNGCGTIHFCGLEVSLTNDRFLMFWSTKSAGVAIYDILTHQFILKKYGLPNGTLIRQMIFTSDGGHIIQLNSDNRYFVYRIKDGEQVLEGHVADEEAILWSSAGYYDATPEGAHFVSLKFPGRYGQYSFQQFEKKLRINGLAQKILSLEDLPSIKLGTPPTLKAKIDPTENNKISIRAVTSATTKFKAINVYQDGILTNELSYGSEIAKSFEIERLPGARWVSVVAVDGDGLVSLPVGRDIGVNKIRQAKLHFLTIGIDQYNQANDLQFAVADAVSIAKALNNVAGQNIELGLQKSLLNQAANKKAILEQMHKMVQVGQKGDTIVFSFAGHGVRDQQGRFYLATSTIDPENITETGFLWQELVAILRKAKGRIVVLLDACHSGAAGTDDSIYATNDEVASGLLSSIPSGLLIFSASKGRELSEEDGVRGGIFTNALTDVISHKRNQFDTNQNGAIEISELYYGVKSEVVKHAQGKQTPWLARNQMVGDFSLF